MNFFLSIKDSLVLLYLTLLILLGVLQVGMAQCGATTTPAVKVFAIQASCTNGVPNNDAYLQISEINDGDKYGYSSGTSYTGNAYGSATTTTGLTYPVVIASNIPNPVADSTFTIRIFNGSNTCFTDSTIVLKVQDCTVTCDCVQHLYLNDTGPDDVHKYAINPSSGAITEIGDPWFDGDDITLDGPHGIAADFNGYLYIGSDPDNFIKKFTCDGVPVDANPTTPAFDNFADINPGRNMFSIGNYLYVNPLGDPKVHLFDLCTGDDIGCMGNIWSWGFVNGEDGYWYGSNGLRIMRGSTDPAAYVANCDDSGMEILCELPSHFTGGADNLANTGLALDGNGGYFIVISGSNGFQPPSTIYHIDENCTPIDSSFTDYSIDLDDTDNRNWAGARGLVVENGFLYVATADDCVAVFDTALNYISNFSDHTKGVYPKAIGKINECCPTNNNITIDTAFCASAVNDILYLQDLVNCTGTICEGVWEEGTGNNGLTYNPCNNSITITSTTACGSFILESDGTGNNPQCGAFKIAVNMEVGEIIAPIIAGNQNICEREDPAAFSISTAATGNSTITYQWQSSPTDCTTGFTDIAGAISATYDPPDTVTDTTYYRVIAAVSGGCSTGMCQDTSNCLIVNVEESPVATVADVLKCTTNSETISVSPSGGTAPYTYTWSGPFLGTPPTTQSFTATNPGIYTVTVEDADGCTITASGEMTFQSKVCLPATFTVRRGRRN